MKITVYFVDNHKAIFDAEKVLFRTTDGAAFSVSDTYAENTRCDDVLRDGRALINWENVCFVNEYVEKVEDL